MNRDNNDGNDKTIINIIIGLSIIMMLVISINNVYALGIAPSKKIIEYDTEEHIINVRIINNEAKDMTLKITATGPLSDAITIDTPILKIKSDEAEKEFKYIVRLPPDLMPGTKSIYVSAAEVNDAASENALSGLLTVSHQLQINVPYVGLYAEGYLTVNSINDKTIAAINIINTGTENIKSLKGTLYIRDLNGDIIYTKKTSEYNDIFPGSSEKIEESLNLGKAGLYIVEYDITYDDKTIILNKDFYTGEPNLIITGASVKNFRLGTIAKLDVNVSNNWNVPLDDVYGEIVVTDINGTIVGRANTTKTTIDPNNGILSVYWDTTNINIGEYTINLKLFAGDKIITQEYPSVVENDKIIIGATKEITKKVNYTVPVVLLSLSILMIVILIRRRNKKIYK